MASYSNTPPDFSQLVNLADASLGAAAVEANDEFFAAKERMLDPSEPLFKPDVYDAHGKWMDGWETRRRREHGHDHCILSLACRGVLRGVDIDTRHFTGNYAPRASIDASIAEDPLAADAHWSEILAPQPLSGNDHNLFGINSNSAWRHLRLNIYPDGGVARLRAYGEVRPDWSGYDDGQLIDLLAIANGGRALECNDQHYGDIRRLIAPGRGKDMGDGWETRRRREPGFDWVILALGHAARIEALEIDTAHFRGNFPQAVSVNAALLHGHDSGSLAASSMHWPSLLKAQAMKADTVHRFEQEELRAEEPVSHLRINLHPDGGISRVRAYGRLA